MAYVKMHQIKATVGRAIKYVTREDATAGGLFVSTNAAVVDPSDWRAIEAEFLATHARQVGRGVKGSVLAHHVIQSFEPGEIASPGMAHSIGRELAERVTGGVHEYVVATHVDKEHVHNHILVNAVGFETGRKWRVQRDTLRSIRGVSDELCRAHGLSLIPAREDSLSEPIGAVYARARGVSRVDALKVSIDRAIGEAATWAEFEGRLDAQGVTVGRSQKRSVTYLAPGMRRPIREARLGAGYSEEHVMARLGRAPVLRFDVHESLIRSATDRTVTLKVPGSGGRRSISVSQDQVVRHGVTLRVYLPEMGRQAILGPRGGIVANVPTAALYAAFAPPRRELIKAGRRADADRIRGSRELRRDLAAMHDQESQLNARAQYGVLTASQAVHRAAALDAELEEGMRDLQALAVALDSAQAPAERRDLSVQLADAQNRCEELQGAATALTTWAEEIEKDAQAQVQAMSLRERLAGLSQHDVTSVTGRPISTDDQPGRARRDREGTNRTPPAWQRMSLNERMEWLQKYDRGSGLRRPDGDPQSERKR